MLTHLYLLLSLIPLSLQLYGNVDGDQICVTACQECFFNVTFGTTSSTDDYYTGYCQDTDRWQSALLCSKFHCSPREIKAGVAYRRNECQPYADTASYEMVIANYSDEAIKNMPVYGSEDMTSSDIVNGTLLPTDELFHRSKLSWVRLFPSFTCIS